MALSEAPNVLEYHHPVSEDRDVRDTAWVALLSGIASVLMCWIPLVAYIAAFLAIISGIDGRRRAVLARYRRFGLAGLIMGVIAAVVQTLILGSMFLAMGRSVWRS